MLKRMVCFVCLMAATVVSHAREGVLSVWVEGVNGEKGILQVAVFNREDAFLEKPFRTKKVAATKDGIDLIFEDLPEGSYAIAVYLDENKNGKLDKNFIGFPKELYGFSNNAKGSILGPPSFQQAKFELSGADLSIRIVLT